MKKFNSLEITAQNQGLAPIKQGGLIRIIAQSLFIIDQFAKTSLITGHGFEITEK